jgi:predicted Fe-Mo cluster-binding NifX family protein
MIRTNTLRLALPVTNGRLHAHFGGSREFALVDVDLTAQTVFALTIVPAPPHQPGLFPRWLRQLGVNTVVAGGIGQRAIDLFTRHNITVRAGQPGTPVEVLAAAFLSGRLERAPEPCANHGHHHDHEHDHEQDHHHDHSHADPDSGPTSS